MPADADKQQLGICYKQDVSGGVIVSEAGGLAVGTSKTRREMDQSSV